MTKHLPSDDSGMFGHMNTEQLKQSLIKTAKQLPVNEQVPFAFEKRVMANILSLSKQENGLFSVLTPRAIWGTILSSSLAILLTGLFYFNTVHEMSTEFTVSDTALVLEDTVFAGLTSPYNLER